MQSLDRPQNVANNGELGWEADAEARRPSPVSLTDLGCWVQCKRAYSWLKAKRRLFCGTRLVQRAKLRFEAEAWRHRGRPSLYGRGSEEVPRGREHGPRMAPPPQIAKNPPAFRRTGFFSYSISRGRFLRLRLRARASFVRRFSPGFR
jgi:hypothetical protein